jgi:hypothetical protein
MQNAPHVHGDNPGPHPRRIHIDRTAKGWTATIEYGKTTDGRTPPSERKSFSDLTELRAHVLPHLARHHKRTGGRR